MRRSLRWRRRAGAVALVALLTAPGAASAASPQPTVVAWSTYLRAGPGETYAAISELEHDTRVGVVGCDGRWCRVSGEAAQGYVDRDALELPRTLAPEPPARTDCVVVGQADNRGPIPTRFCSAPSGRR